MIQIIQKIFLSPSKIAEKNQQREIIQLLSSTPIVHHAYVTRNNLVARHFSIKTKTYSIYTERTYDHSRPENEQIQYTLHVTKYQKVIYATHSSIDKFAQHVYKKMRKSWEKSNQHVK